LDVRVFVDMGASDARKSQQEMAEKYLNKHEGEELKAAEVDRLPDSGKLQSKKGDPAQASSSKEMSKQEDDKDSGEMAPGSDKFTAKEAEDAVNEGMARSREAEDRQGPVSMGGV